jgi:hypothetical protein
MTTIKEILLNTLLCIPKEVTITIIHEYAKCYGPPKLKNIIDVKKNDDLHEPYIVCSNKEFFITNTSCIYIYDKFNYEYVDTITLIDDIGIKGMSLYDNELFVGTKSMYVFNVNDKKIIRRFKPNVSPLNFCVDENNIIGDNGFSNIVLLNKQDGSFVDRIIIDNDPYRGIGVSNKYIYICYINNYLSLFDKKTYQKVDDSSRQEDFLINCNDLMAFFDNELYIIPDDELIIFNKYNKKEIVANIRCENINLSSIDGIALCNNIIFIINGDKLCVLERDLL